MYQSQEKFPKQCKNDTVYVFIFVGVIFMDFVVT